MPETSETCDRVMVIGAHPDDPEFGCAGTVVKWAAAGRKITYVLLTSGDKGSHDRNLHPGMLAARREKEQRAAAQAIGVEQTVFLRHPDGLLQNSLELRRQITHLIRQFRPHTLMTIDPWRRYQLHPDHRAAGQAALDAIYAAREWYIFPEQMVDHADPWHVREAFLFWTDQPDYWEDISQHVETRIAALAQHASQVGQDPARLGKRIRQRTQAAGEQAGYEHAEAFKRFQFR